MNKYPSFIFQQSTQKGLTLIELMIAMLLGLIIIGGIGKIFIGSNQSYRLQEALSRIQENGRFAITYLEQEIRPAGFQGCPNLSAVKPNILADSVAENSITFQTAVMGYDFDGTDTSQPSGAISNTDIINIERGGGCGAKVTKVGGPATANIKVEYSASCNFEEDDVLIVSDCKTTDIFSVTNTPDNNKGTTDSVNWQNLAHASSGNRANFLSKEYDENAEIYKFDSRDFYIKNNDFGIPSLFQKNLNGDEGELIEGIEDMQITYGLTVGNSFTYLPAGSITQWKNVKSVRVSLLLQSIEDNLTLAPVSIEFNGETMTPTDRRIRKVFSTTIFLRNRA